MTTTTQYRYMAVTETTKTNDSEQLRFWAQLTWSLHGEKPLSSGSPWSILRVQLLGLGPTLPQPRRPHTHSNFKQ